MLKKVSLLILITVMQLLTVYGAADKELNNNNTLLEKPTKSFLDYEDPLKSKDENLSITKVAVRMIFSLLAVLALMLLSLFLIKKFMPKAAGISSDNNLKLFKVIEQVKISPKETIHLVWSVDRILILASSEKGLNLLSEIKDQNVLNNNMPEDFSDILANRQLNMAEIYSA